MRCTKCGHENPESNRYCGMCGEQFVPAESTQAKPERLDWGLAGRETLPPAALEHVEGSREERGQEPAEAGAPTPPRRSDKWWVDEGETTVGGPSFLGISSGQSVENGGYSYLFVDEPEKSHAGWVFLLVLLILGGVGYAKRQPIRDFVVAQLNERTKPAPVAGQQTPDANVAATTPGAPTTTLASNEPESTKDAAASATAPKEGLPQSDKGGAAGGDKHEPGAEQPAASPQSAAGSDNKSTSPEPRAGSESARPSQHQAGSGHPKAEASGDEEEDTSAAEEEKPSASRRAAPADAGNELVSSGEKFLYGKGVARSCDQAVSYFRAAAGKQNSQAFSHLGALYATGECVPMDRALAYSYFKRAYAKEPANHYYEQNLTMLWREMSPDEKQRATSR
ncbi:MAG: hypothetical protein ACR2IF_05405 [Terriglobales bacterium]